MANAPQSPGGPDREPIPTSSASFSLQQYAEYGRYKLALAQRMLQRAEMQGGSEPRLVQLRKDIENARAIARVISRLSEQGISLSQAETLLDDGNFLSIKRISQEDAFAVKRFFALNELATMERDTMFKKWQTEEADKRQTAARVAIQESDQAAREASVRAAREVRAAAGIPDKEAIERRREQIIEIILQHGGVRFHADVDDDISSSGTRGFWTMNGQRLNNKGSDMMIQDVESRLMAYGKAGNVSQEGTVLRQHNRREMVGFLRAREAEYETVEIPEVRGIFGRVKQPSRTESRPTGRTIEVKHSTIVRGGQDEPAVWLVYGANSHQDDKDWRVTDGRPGQTLEVAMGHTQ